MVLITYTPFYLIEEFNSVCLSILLARAHPLVRRFSTQGCCGALAVAEHHNNKDYISYYLAGLLEGDGHFNTPKKLCTPSRRRDLFRDASLPPTFMPQGPGVVRESPSPGTGTARVAAIETVFALKDRRSAELLQSLFGGKIYDHPTKKLTR